MSSVPRREQNKRRVRRGLIEAARVLFLERGFDAVPVSEIAAAANVSRRSFFRYFASKEAVAFPRHEADLTRFRSDLAAGRDDSLRDSLRGAGLHLAEAYHADSATLLDTHRIIEGSPTLAAADRARDREWEDALREELVCRGIPSAEAAVRAGALFGMMQAVRREWLRTGAKDDLAERATEALALLDKGLLD